jgi:hypothetical protein
VELLDKPLRDTVLQAMARAYPDPVDLVLLSMVTGAEPAILQAETADLIHAGLALVAACAGAPTDPRAVCISDRGMAVACGMATDSMQAKTLLGCLEAQTLRALLSARIGASRLPPMQREELRHAITKVPDSALMDAARIWAHQPASDWHPLVRALMPQPREASLGLHGLAQAGTQSV